ncbi:MAG: restriction endonuclease subunit S [Bacteroides sp.]|nr:restriction endonuclease subunit S [Bacteroides sp.]
MGKEPAIRFENYTGDWEQRKFAELFDTLANNTLSRAELTEETGIGRDVHYGDILVKFGECLSGVSELPFIAKDQTVKKFSSSRLQNGDVIIADTAEDETVGKCMEILEVQGEIVLAGLHTIPCRPRKKFAPAYLGYFMNSSAYHDQLRPLMQGIKVTSISKSALQDTILVMPKSYDEQKQIGRLFLGLDHLITLHQRNYEKMVVTKKSMLDKLFPQGEANVPAIRFEGFEGDWEKKPLSAIVVPYTDPVKVPHDGYERLGIRSHGKGVFHEYVEAGKEITTAQLHRVAAHNFIVNITFAWEHAVAITSDKDEGKLVSHRFPQFSMADGIYDQFLKYMILDARFRHHLLLSSPGGAGRNRVLKIPEMLEYEMRIPDIEEQKQIAGYLNSLDDLIELYRIRIEKLKNIKAACLQGMFL